MKGEPYTRWHVKQTPGSKEGIRLHTCNLSCPNSKCRTAMVSCYRKGVWSGFILKRMTYRQLNIMMIWQMDQSTQTDSRLLKHSWQPPHINLIGLISISICRWPNRNQQWTICMTHHYVNTVKLILHASWCIKCEPTFKPF